MDWIEIKAKWESQCPECESTIIVGNPVMWKKGEKAIHKHCHIEEKKGFVKYSCPRCNREIHVKRNKLDLSELCSECNNELNR